MKNQPDSESLSPLLAQITALAGAAGADLALRWEKSGLAIYRGESLLRAYPAPVRAGAVLGFMARQTGQPMAESLPDSLNIGPYVFYPRRALLVQGSEEIVLTDKERDILGALWAAPDRALSREDLLDAVWAYAQGVETHTLETHIYRLRRKIEDDPADPAYLVNEDGLYRLKA